MCFWKRKKEEQLKLEEHLKPHDQKAIPRFQKVVNSSVIVQNFKENSPTVNSPLTLSIKEGLTGTSFLAVSSKH